MAPEDRVHGCEFRPVEAKADGDAQHLIRERSDIRIGRWLISGRSFGAEILQPLAALVPIDRHHGQQEIVWELRVARLVMVMIRCPSLRVFPTTL
jgi:hypothetical protein